jgi:ribonuclease D
LNTLAAVDESVVWVMEPGALARTVAELGAEPVAFDLEADSLHRYRERICLVQLGAAGRILLVDPLRGAAIRELGGFLACPDREKILHGADYDLRLLRRESGIEARGIFDTMIAARLCGEREFGLGALLRRYLGIDLPKAYQRADWSRRPLPADMIAYAVADVRHLPELALRLRERLGALGRTAWAAEECRWLESPRAERAPEAEPWRQARGAGRLGPAGLAVLRELHAFRDAEARRRDVPPFRVMRDEALVAVAEREPRTPSDLAAIAHLPRRHLEGPGADAILARVRQGLAVRPDARPAVHRTRRRSVDPKVERGVARLRAERDQLAGRLDLDPSVLAPRSLLEALVARVGAGEGIEGTPGLREWQRELLEPLLQGGGEACAS